MNQKLKTSYSDEQYRREFKRAMREWKRDCERTISRLSKGGWARMEKSIKEMANAN